VGDVPVRLKMWCSFCGFQRIYMDLNGFTGHGFTWIYMDLHGFAWIQVDLHGLSHTFFLLEVSIAGLGPTLLVDQVKR